ncbi:MAG: beta-lactamase family protein [Myxococcota bacterium]|nr:beta-lactamase family protein [Myxococcota bacterium]
MTADNVARRIVADAIAPQCGTGCAIRVDGTWRRELGGSVDVLFDLASVTKPMSALALARTGIDRRLPLGAALPEARGTASESVALELFLAHRAGLEGHRPVFAPLLRGEKVDIRAALRDAADARREDARGDPPAEGFTPLYSDLGYILVGEALARMTATPDAGASIERLVLEPLGIADHAGTVRELAARGVRGPFAPTETVSWRGGPICGAVHDENAWALTGFGGSGHAGIFATVGAVITFGAAILDTLDGANAPFGAPCDIDWMVGERAGGSLRAGFDGKSSEGSSAGDRMGRRSFGHLGFTGTSLWMDPDSKVVVALLTNRVSPSRDHIAIRAARPSAHDALVERALTLKIG